MAWRAACRRTGASTRCGRATPETAYLAKVRIEAARWQAARLAPTKYGDRPLEGETAEDRRPVFNITVRNFGEEGGTVPAEAAKLAGD